MKITIETKNVAVVKGVNSALLSPIRLSLRAANKRAKEGLGIVNLSDTEAMATALEEIAATVAPNEV